MLTNMLVHAGVLGGVQGIYIHTTKNVLIQVWCEAFCRNTSFDALSSVTARSTWRSDSSAAAVQHVQSAVSTQEQSKDM